MHSKMEMTKEYFLSKIGNVPCRVNEHQDYVSDPMYDRLTGSSFYVTVTQPSNKYETVKSLFEQERIVCIHANRTLEDGTHLTEWYSEEPNV